MVGVTPTILKHGFTIYKCYTDKEENPSTINKTHLHLYIGMNHLTSFKIQRRFFLLLKIKPYKLSDSTHEENFIIAFLFS